MKPHRSASELAARLGAAANKPVPLPETPTLKIVATPPAPEAPTARAVKKAKPAQPVIETVPITLRPTRALLNRYTLAAPDRTRETGRVISAQEMMLEQLERTA